MTDIQSMMLAFCFGSVVGTLIANIVVIVKFVVDAHRDKKRKRKDAEDKR